MNPKITASALRELQGKRPDELVLLTLRTNVVLSDDQFQMLTAWGARPLYDNGCMVLIYIPAFRVSEIALWDSVIEIR
jgi:hypothetical protein